MGWLRAGEMGEERGSPDLLGGAGRSCCEELQTKGHLEKKGER